MPPGTMRVLIVDDHERMRAAVRLLLSPLANHFHEAGEGGEAVEAFRRHQPDWVIMDVQMRPMNGLQATARIRLLDPAARVVILTQYDDPITRVEAASAGACGFLAKEELHRLPELLSGLTAGGSPDFSSHS